MLQIRYQIHMKVNKNTGLPFGILNHSNQLGPAQVTLSTIHTYKIYK